MTAQTETHFTDLDGRAPLRFAIPLGLQHILAMFTSNLAPILIVSGAMRTVGYEVNLVYLLQMAMFVSAVATFMQLYPIGPVGARMPIVMGTAFTFVGVCTVAGVKYGPRGLFGTVIVASIVEIVIGVILPYVARLFTPVVSGMVVIAIGLKLLSVGATYMGGAAAATATGWGSPTNVLLGFVTVLAYIIFAVWGKGILKTSALFMAIVVGFLLAIALGAVDWSPLGRAGWVTVPIPFTTGMPTFHLDVILLMGVLYVITALQTMGDVSAIAYGALNREPKAREFRGAVLADGIGSMLAGIFSALPNTSFAQNTGIVLTTKVVNRFTVALGAGALLLASLVPKVGAIFSVIPLAVIGGGLVMVFPMIVVTGIRMVASYDLSKRSGIIVGASLAMFGIASVPAWKEVAFNAANYPVYLQWLATTGRWFFEDGIASAGVTAVALHMILPKDPPTEADPLTDALGPAPAASETETPEAAVSETAVPKTGASETSVSETGASETGVSETEVSVTGVSKTGTSSTAAAREG